MATRVRFSSTSGTRSAIVPSATTSVKGRSASGTSTRLAARLQQRMRELEGDADAGELRERRPGSLGLDDDAVRQRALDLVVVGDDDVHAELVRPGHLVARADAAVDRHEQLDALGGELLDGRGAGRRSPR